jgi:hypothetical protein
MKALPLHHELGQLRNAASDEGTFAQAGLRPFLPLRINQDCLLPSAWCLVGAMNAARPATGAFLTLQQLVTGSLNATLARLRLFCVIHPADELIPTERRQAFPQHKDFRIRSQGCLKAFACFVDSAMWESVRHATSKQCGQQAWFTNSQ